MAFDGIVMANLAHELQEELQGGRMSKIAQPEKDELLLTIKTNKGQRRLLLSASPSLPLIYLRDENKPSPMTAPNFCMLLRKHIGSGRILSITQPKLERILNFTIEHLDDLGDVCQKLLIVEIMGKHSNIIFAHMDGRIIDSIKHISSHTSSVREVLPGRKYFIPDTMEKLNPLDVLEEDFITALKSKPLPLAKSIYTSFTGISPVIAEEICLHVNIDSSASFTEFTPDIQLHIYKQFILFFDHVKQGAFTPTIYYQEGLPKEFSSLPLQNYKKYESQTFTSPSEMVFHYYAVKSVLTRIRQKSTDLRQIVQRVHSRNVKKYDLQLKQIQDTKNQDKFRIYGELINTYGYDLKAGSKELVCLNYYDDNKEIKIPLDPFKTPGENAIRYFDKYNKQKRTFEALSALIEETKEEITYLESVANALEMATGEEDLSQIKEELIDSGYMRRKVTSKKGNKKEKFKNKPLHFLSRDGYHIYVGKNNLQNDQLTFDFATGNDWWFHAKNAPGSHVILKKHKDGDIPNTTFEDAGKLAAHYSVLRGKDRKSVV